MNNKLLYFFNNKQKKTLTLIFVFMLVGTIVEMLGLGFIFSIVGALSPETAKNNLLINKLSVFLELGTTEVFLYLLVAFLLFYIIKTIFLTYYNWYETNFLYMYKEYLSSQLFKDYLDQDFSYFSNRNSAEFIRNLIAEATHFMGYLYSVIKILLETIILAGILFFLAYINLNFTIVILVIFLSFSSLYFFLLKERLNIWGKQRQTNMKKLIQFMREGFDGIKIIKLLGRENFFFSKFKKHNENLSSIAAKTIFFQGMPKLLFELIGIFLITLSLLIFNYYEKTTIEIAQMLSVYIAASFRILPSINKIVQSLQMMKLNYPSMDTLYNEMKSFKKKPTFIHEDFLFKQNILVDIKKFIHPNSKNFEILDIKLNISKGQKIGIIGPSGSGKSTIIEIITGILKPRKGSIQVDGKPIESNIRGWQKLIGFVPQKIFILDESLRNNILFGLDKEKYTDQKIIKILKKLSLEKLLNRLPNGLDQNLGEDGLNISGGEIQRIGLCRALIYDPEILFLDEATSSLDVDTESQILDELKIFEEKTIISIAHRINTLKNCEKIYSFDNGKIVDEGSFDKFKIKN